MATKQDTLVYAALQLTQAGTACVQSSIEITDEPANAVHCAYTLESNKKPTVMVLVGTQARLDAAVRNNLLTKDEDDDVYEVNPFHTEAALSGVFTEGGVYAVQTYNTEMDEEATHPATVLAEIAYERFKYGVCATFGTMFSKEFIRDGLHKYTNTPFSLDARYGLVADEEWQQVVRSFYDSGV